MIRFGFTLCFALFIFTIPSEGNIWSNYFPLNNVRRFEEPNAPLLKTKTRQMARWTQTCSDRRTKHVVFKRYTRKYFLYSQCHICSVFILLLELPTERATDICLKVSKVPSGLYDDVVLSTKVRKELDVLEMIFLLLVCWVRWVDCTRNEKCRRQVS